VPFRLGLWRCTSIWDLRITCFSQSLVYAATHWLLATNCSRAALIVDGVLLGVLPGGVSYLELSVFDGETRIIILGAAPVAEMIVGQTHGDPGR
jgi:hypothetical protein